MFKLVFVILAAVVAFAAAKPTGVYVSPVGYSYGSPLAYSAPVAYSGYASPLAYSGYSPYAATPVAYAASPYSYAASPYAASPYAASPYAAVSPYSYYLKR